VDITEDKVGKVGGGDRPYVGWVAEDRRQARLERGLLVNSLEECAVNPDLDPEAKRP
jgi:hypothetical protein